MKSSIMKRCRTDDNETNVILGRLVDELDLHDTDLHTGNGESKKKKKTVHRSIGLE